LKFVCSQVCGCLCLLYKDVFVHSASFYVCKTHKSSTFKRGFVVSDKDRN